MVYLSIYLYLIIYLYIFEIAQGISLIKRVWCDLIFVFKNVCVCVCVCMCVCVCVYLCLSI